VAVLALWALPSTPRNRVSLAAAILAILDATFIAILQYLEHFRSKRPSLLLTGYLALSILLDLAQVRSLFLQGLPALGSLSAAVLGLKFALLFLEEGPKRRFLEEKNHHLSAEETSGLGNRSVFWWLNTLFVQGFRNLLQTGDLGNIDGKFDSRALLERLSASWNRQGRFAKHRLLKATLSALRLPFLAPVLPRLCLGAFSFAQPFLVNRVISFVSEPATTDSRAIAGGLIAATALIYIGLAILRGLYNHLIYQLITMLRGGLVGLIFQKSMGLETTTAAEGAATTLMSTDIDGIATGIREIHEIWACIVELGIAVYLLQLQIGAACFAVAIPMVGKFLYNMLAIHHLCISREEH